MNKPYLKQEDSGKYTPRCDTCSWIGPTVTDKGLATIMLDKHAKQRVHRTLTYAPHRFKA